MGIFGIEKNREHEREIRGAMMNKDYMTVLLGYL